MENFPRWKNPEEEFSTGLWKTQWKTGEAAAFFPSLPRFSAPDTTENFISRPGKLWINEWKKLFAYGVHRCGPVGFRQKDVRFAGRVLPVLPRFSRRFRETDGGFPRAASGAGCETLSGWLPGRPVPLRGCGRSDAGLCFPMSGRRISIGSAGIGLVKNGKAAVWTHAEDAMRI